MKVFVTGGTGFVGSHLVAALLERGDEVVCLVRNPAKLNQRFRDSEPQSVAGDLDDDAALRAGCTGVDVVFHSAGVTAAHTRAEFFAVNADGTRRVAEAAAEAAPNLTRFVYVSSQAAGGPSRCGTLKTETDEADPISDYGASKLAGESVVRKSGLPWTVIRPPGVYGPFDSGFLTVFRLARFGIVPVIGDGKQELSLVFVSDLVHALLQATLPATASRTYFACNREVTTASGFARAVHRAVQRSLGTTRKLIVLPLPGWVTRATLRLTGTSARLLGRTTLLSTDKAKELLAEAWTCDPTALERDTGWSATVDLEDGLRQTADWYRENGWL
ncbi:MAG: NAD(P)-dependent oxidoreductase [Gemmatimonadota bacterium]|nr:MAG: NAD(P)-dependent oxidoreductase [Gemmatimonadota bacterium]